MGGADGRQDGNDAGNLGGLSVPPISPTNVQRQQNFAQMNSAAQAIERLERQIARDEDELDILRRDCAKTPKELGRARLDRRARNMCMHMYRERMKRITDLKLQIKDNKEE